MKNILVKLIDINSKNKKIIENEKTTLKEIISLEDDLRKKLQELEEFRQFLESLNNDAQAQYYIISQNLL